MDFTRQGNRKAGGCSKTFKAFLMVLRDDKLGQSGDSWNGKSMN